METAISLKSVCKIYNSNETVVALDDVSFDISEGEIVAIFGHNGSGKSTLIELIAGTQNPTSGSIEIFGEKPRTKNTRIGYLPQNINLYEELTVKELIDYFVEMNEKERTTSELIEEFNLSSHSNTKYSNLSGGYKRRVALACVVSSNPKIIILDEPSSGLDSKNQEDLWNFIFKLKSEGKTVVVSTHDYKYIEKIDKILSLSHGKIEYFGNNNLSKRQYVVTVDDETVFDTFQSIGNKYFLNSPDELLTFLDMLKQHNISDININISPGGTQ